MTGAVLEQDAQQRLITELARIVLDEAAPEETVLLPETADEYFADPDGVLAPARRDETLGFGIELSMLTPYVLAALIPVVQFLVGAVTETAKQQAQPRLEELVRRLFRRKGGAPVAPESAPAAGSAAAAESAPAAITTEQARRTRDLAFGRARSAGLDEERAGLLADALVGALVIAG